MTAQTTARLVVLCGLVLCACGDRAHTPRDTAGAARSTDSPGSAPVSDRRREPPLSRRDRDAWRPVLSWPASCEEAFEASASSDDAGLVFTRLTEPDTLVDVLCAAGGYQPSHTLVVLDDGGGTKAARVLRVPVLTSSDGASWTRTEETEIWGEVRVQPGTGDIVVLSVARQTRDCGVWSRYRVSRAGAELTEVWAGLPCRNPPGAVAELADGPPKGWRPVAMN